MSASTHKKVLLRLLHPPSPSLGLPTPHPDFLAGFIDPAQLTSGGGLELLTPAGKAQTIALSEVQSIFFVSDFDHLAAVLALFPGPRRGARTAAAERSASRQAGLLVRIRFRDRQTLEAVLDNELFPVPDGGYSLLPVRADSPCQRVFIPQTAVAQITVIEVLRPARVRRPSPRAQPAQEAQFPLFAGVREEEP